MERQQHIELILDHYQSPRHRHRLRQPHAVQTGYNPGCGDEVTVYLAVEGPEQRLTLAFEGQGCTVSQAAASMLMEMMQGRPLPEVEAAAAEPLLALLGPEIARSRERCALLAFHTLKRAIEAYRQGSNHREEP
ncbi:MAG: iron-sulfur cluster assembly scaffold protein [Caldilineales bacterium]|nr:iron-sulfur cluster assembly scaffold protein [Caldilineales bacterium]MDW8318558.1 iron-sulfur cluster assembly scaffold protein [Anaerolineae bacterium]